MSKLSGRIGIVAHVAVVVDDDMSDKKECFLIAYDLIPNDRKNDDCHDLYDDLGKFIESLGDATRVLESVGVVITRKSIGEIYKLFIGFSDSISKRASISYVVTQMDRNLSFAVRLKADVSECFKKFNDGLEGS